MDWCSYALAAMARMPLLAVGGDFAHTDVELADLSLGKA
jgi:uncharacterized protein with PIN domain